MTSWELNCCDGVRSIARQLRSAVLSGERAAICLASDIVLDCTVCVRDDPQCVSSVNGSFCGIDVLMSIANRLDREQLELALHKLASDGRWAAIGRLAARWPCTVPAVLDTEAIPVDELAASGQWSVVLALARAGILRGPFTGALQSWVPHSIKGQTLRCELRNYAEWLKGKPAPTKLVLSAVKFALRVLPNELVDRICKNAGLL